MVTLRAAILLALTAFTIWLCRQGQGPTLATEAGVNMYLPYKVGDYWGTDEPISTSEKTLLPPDTEFAKKSYESVSGDRINCQIVLSGADKRSIHRPEVCLPGQGWTIQSGEVLPISLANGKKLSVMKLTLSRSIEISPGNRKTITMFFLYWFIGKDKTTPYHWERILLSNWDRIRHNVNHRWAYIIVSCPVMENFQPGGRNAADTLKMLQEFIVLMAPNLLKDSVQTK